MELILIASSASLDGILRLACRYYNEPLLRLNRIEGVDEWRIVDKGGDMRNAKIEKKNRRYRLVLPAGE